MVGEYKFYCTKDLLTPPKKKKRKKGCECPIDVKD